jgi:SAM-dependent methyltransferase
MSNQYSQAWDHYVGDWSGDLTKRTDLDARLASDGGRGKVKWPGDEWGNEEIWKGVIDRLLVPAGLSQWKRVIEIGQGSGKYTLPVLAQPDAQVKCFDMSQKFLDVCGARCADYVKERRLSLHCLVNDQPRMIQQICEQEGWTRNVDAFMSIDAMVHVDLNILASYFLAASEVLKPGGKLVMTLADVSSDAGFEKLMRELTYTFNTAGQFNCQFEWLHPALVKDLLPRFGFEVTRLANAWRDIELIATFVDPQSAAKAKALSA